MSTAHGRPREVSETAAPVGSGAKGLLKSILASRALYGRLRARALKTDPVSILCYHTLRPDGEAIDAWTAVRKSHFVRQIDYLRANYDIVSLDAAFDAPQAHRGRPRAVITFDDGEVGLHDVLLPLVADLKIPVTLYIATGHIETGRAYWFDDVMNALQAPGPFIIDLAAAGRKTWRIPAERGVRRWSVISDVLETLKKIGPEERAVLTDAILARAPSRGDPSAKPLAPLSIAQLTDLARSEWVTIAAHSHCHNLLDQIPAAQARESIARSRTILEQWTGNTVHHFAYPNGNHNETVRRIVSDLGFKSAVALDDGLWHRDMDRHALPRVCVGRYDDLNRLKLRLVGI